MADNSGNEQTAGAIGTQAVDWYGRHLEGPKGFYIIISSVLAALFLIRGLLFDGATNDDAEQLLFSQDFAWGYILGNPPLYTWIVIAVQQVIGINLPSVTAVKFALLWLTYHFLFKSARMVLDDDRLAIVAALSPFGFYYVAWDALLGYSHTVLAACLYAATFLGLLRARSRGDLKSFVLLGVAIGLGLISKYTYVLFTMAMTCACFADPAFRKHLIRPYALATIVIAGAIASPHFAWVIAQSDQISAAAEGKFEIAAGSNYARTVLSGFANSLSIVTGFLSPLWIILLAVFHRAIWERLRSAVAPNRHQRFLAVYLMALVALLVGAVLVFEITKLRPHYMFLLVLFPIFFFAFLKPVLKNTRSLRVYHVILLSLAVFSLAGMTIKYVSEPWRCKRCQLLLPYDEIARQIRQSGYKNGTIYAYWFPHALPGNLRVYFPDQRIVSVKFTKLAPAPSGGSGQCLMIWMPKPRGVMDAKGMIEISNRQLGVSVPDREKFLWAPVRNIEFTYARTESRTDQLHFILLENGQGKCR